MPKILVIKLCAVGDLVLASPFFEQLRNHFCKSEITLLTGKSCYQSIENNPCFDQVLIANDSSLYVGTFMDQVQETLRLIRMLRREKFDLVFVLHRAWQFNMMAYLSGIKQRVGFTKKLFSNKFFLTDPVKMVCSQNERESFLDLLRKIGVSAEFEKTFFYLSEEEDTFSHQFLKKNNIVETTPIVAIAPGGGNNVKNNMPSRRWPEKYFVSLIQKILRDHKCKIFMVGGPGDREAIRNIQRQIPECVDGSHLSFGEMAAVLRHCNVFVGNDSGPIHIASAMGIPTIGLYGPTDPKQWGSPTASDTILFKEEVECSPCYKDGKFPDCDHLTCLHSIEVEEVWSHLHKILSRSFKPNPITQLSY